MWPGGPSSAWDVAVATVKAKRSGGPELRRSPRGSLAKPMRSFQEFGGRGPVTSATAASKREQARLRPTRVDTQPLTTGGASATPSAMCTAKQLHEPHHALQAARPWPRLPTRRPQHCEPPRPLPLLIFVWLCLCSVACSPASESSAHLKGRSSVCVCLSRFSLFLSLSLSVTVPLFGRRTFTRLLGIWSAFTLRLPPSSSVDIPEGSACQMVEPASRSPKKRGGRTLLDVRIVSG